MSGKLLGFIAAPALLASIRTAVGPRSVMTEGNINKRAK
jgi:hypothetical protein